MPARKGRQSKSSKTNKRGVMDKIQSVYHDIGKERTDKTDDNPYYMEDMERER